MKLLQKYEAWCDRVVVPPLHNAVTRHPKKTFGAFAALASLGAAHSVATGNYPLAIFEQAGALACAFAGGVGHTQGRRAGSPSSATRPIPNGPAG